MRILLGLESGVLRTCLHGTRRARVLQSERRCQQDGVGARGDDALVLGIAQGVRFLAASRLG